MKIDTNSHYVKCLTNRPVRCINQIDNHIEQSNEKAEKTHERVILSNQNIEIHRKLDIVV